MKKMNELNGYDKASIIIDLLGDSLALNIFKDISESDFYELRKHAKKISPEISTTIKKEVLDDYYLKMLAANKFQGASLNKDMFDFLHELNDEQIYELLSIEKPRVIALALEQIENSKRMKFLSKLDQNKQTETVLQTGNLNDIPLEAVIQIAKDLKKKTSFLPGPVEFSRGGGKSVSNMLSKMPEDDAEMYLNKMKVDNPDLYQDVKKYFFLFEDIINMPEKPALILWSDSDMDLDVMAKSLKGCTSETIEKLREYLPGKKQAMFTPIEEEESIPKHEIDIAKNKIKNLLQTKIATGEIQIEDILASDN